MRNHLSNEDKNLLIGLKTEMENQYSGIAPKMNGAFRATTKPLVLKEYEEPVKTPSTATMQSATTPLEPNVITRQPEELQPEEQQPEEQQPEDGTRLASDPRLPLYPIDTSGGFGGGGGGGAADPSGKDKVVPKKKNWKWILLILALIALIAYARSIKNKTKIKA